MSRRLPASMFAAVLAGALVAAALVVALGHGGGQRPHAERFLGRTPASAPIDFTLSLRLPGQRALDRFLRDVDDPSSPQYRHYLDAVEFGRRFGLPAAELARTRQRLERLGVHVTRSYPQRTTLDARASAATLRRVFRVRLLEYRDRRGRRFHVPATDAVVPAKLAGALDGVAGLNSQPVDPTAKESPVVSGFRPADFARAYDFERLWKQGNRGAGQTVAVYSEYTFREADVNQFDKTVGSSKPGICSASVRTGCIKPVPVNGGATDTDEEAQLDVETIHGIAPDALVLNYEVATPDSFASDQEWGDSFVSTITAVVNQVVKDGRAKILSISYGWPDHSSVGTFSAADIRAGEKAFAAARANGVNTFVASGDQGAYQCQQADPKNHRLCVAWPEESASVIAVGGTLLDVQGDGGYLNEAGWQDTVSGWGGGGGLSQTIKRPSWQSGSVPGVKNRFSNGMRQTPDVSAAGSSASGAFVVFKGDDTSVGGTSASAPVWAGIAALIANHAKDKHAGPLPYLNPVLYRLGRSSKPHLFHDVVRGGNRFYRAVSGWDYSTGLGTPDAYNLARAIAGSIK